ncbi:NADH-quinone oxidoreductase subunit A [Candidatus Saganbacteria bacterium]|nr:NADH-quinone oxidoreductase subunit A [Candidatus Saganbacteria bacterium]
MLELVIFFLVGVGFVLGGFAMAFFFAPHHPSAKKLSCYECGEEPISGSHIQYNVRYYLFGLAFVIFDVEVVFLAPCVLVLKYFGMTGFIEILIFVFILLMGLAYAWKKGDLEWI